MRIKELSDRTLVSPRLLRYYEDQNLISPHRQDNGYRDYDESLVERVRQIRGLLDIGLTTRIIKDPSLSRGATNSSFRECRS